MATMGNAREIHCNELILSASAEPPALPPRPPLDQTVSNVNAATSHSNARHPDGHDSGAAGARPSCSPCSRKYVLLCAACGGLAVVLGGLFAVLYFVLRSYTSSLHYFETVPSYVASVVLIVTGLLMLCFGWRRNRFGYLVKLCGVCCLVCAVVCVVITVTTTVVHMNRLQTLRECIYNARGKSCTCFTGPSIQLMNQAVAAAAAAVHNIHQSAPPPPSAVQSTLHKMNLTHLNEEGMGRFIFADTPDCEVVHGALYACLRALFGLSVIGILVSLFCGMLVYQLLGHERKKMYWEQLELRSRALFRRHHPPPCCGCCTDCRFAAANGGSPAANSTNLLPPWPPWDVLDDSRYWSLHGGNLYSPGPCANGGAQANVGGISHCNGQGHAGAGGGVCPAHRNVRNAGASSSANASTSSWNWLPWRPSSSDNSASVSGGSASGRTTRTQTEGGASVIIGPDDHYGFPLSGNSANYRSPLAVSTAANLSAPSSAAAATATATAAPTAAPSSPAGGEQSAVAVVPWGPPPPYSSRGGSGSETGSVSASTSLCLSPAGSPDPTALKSPAKCSSAATSPNGSVTRDKDTNSLRKDARLFVRLNGVPPPTHRNVDPRRLPWSPSTAGIGAPPHSAAHPLVSQSFTFRSSASKNLHADSPGIREKVNGGRLDPESELYFADTSSYTGHGSVHNDNGSNESTMYEEIRHGHRYDTIQRPQNGKPPPPPVMQRTHKSAQRSSWDGQSSQRPGLSGVGLAAVSMAPPRSRHSADTMAGKEKIFSPIVLPKFVNCAAQSAPWVMSSVPHLAAAPAVDTCSFVPYRRAAVLTNGVRPFGSGEVYENVTSLDFDDGRKKPRTLSPDEEVAILTSQFRSGPADGDLEPTPEAAIESDTELDDGDSVIRAVNV